MPRQRLILGVRLPREGEAPAEPLREFARPLARGSAGASPSRAIPSQPQFLSNDVALVDLWNCFPWFPKAISRNLKEFLKKRLTVYVWRLA